jgi:hypothetical protein
MRLKNMKTLAKSLFLNVPIEIAYATIGTADSSRYTSDLTGNWSSRISKETQNAKIVFECRDNQGRYIVTEISFRKINDSSCETILNFHFDHVDQTYIGIILAEIINGYVMLDIGYNSK